LAHDAVVQDDKGGFGEGEGWDIDDAGGEDALDEIPLELAGRSRGRNEVTDFLEIEEHLRRDVPDVQADSAVCVAILYQ
jgi:hypothetical protein